MIISRTYPGIVGTNYIQNAELAFAVIYMVKREGTEYDPYVSGSTNRTYIHEPATGKIYFINGFEPGETVFVMFKIVGAEPETPPGVCVPVTANQVSLTTQARVGGMYTRAYNLTGTLPYNLTVITKPSWSTVSFFGDHMIRLRGIPDVEGTETLHFTVGNCSGSGLATVNTTFEVLPEINNLFVNTVPFTRINSVTGIPFAITSGFLPMLGGYIPVTAVHGDYTGTITVNVSHITFPRSLELKRNGVILETIPLPGSGTYVFASQIYLSTDAINITLS